MFNKVFGERFGKMIEMKFDVKIITDRTLFDEKIQELQKKGRIGRNDTIN
ncbi:MAG: hypothetical protein NZZ41_02855 [Candidatus Dojkabacteria bacterium]|nr:hypothetical protein [Candidatus Dojkabacteria bacterium]